LLGSVWWGHTEAAALLIDAGADVQIKNHEEISPWKAAETLDDKEMQKLLRKAGAKPRSLQM
jgi:ankyrin repeat protein